MKKIRVFVLSDGSVVSRYADVLVSKGKLDPQSVKRVTNVEWNVRLEMWTASTLTGKAIICSRTRGLCLEMEGEFVDRLLSQFFLCRTSEGYMVCPECKTPLDGYIRPNCLACGKAFPVAQEGFEWRDFELSHLYATQT